MSCAAFSSSHWRAPSAGLTAYQGTSPGTPKTSPSIKTGSQDLPLSPLFRGRAALVKGSSKGDESR
jgi:hypothetical protein